MEAAAPARLSLGMRGAERAVLVLDLGLRNGVKCGLAGETRPRAVLRDGAALARLRALGERAMRRAPAPAPAPTGAPEEGNCSRRPRAVTREDWLEAVLHVLNEVYFAVLHLKPRERKVLVVVHDLAPSHLIWAVGRAVLELFGAPALVVVPTCAVALFPSGLASGVVVDCARGCEARVAVLVDGAAVLRAVASCALVGSEQEQLEAAAGAVLEALRCCPAPARQLVVSNVLVCGSGALPADALVASVVRLAGEREAAALPLLSQAARDGARAAHVCRPPLLVPPETLAWVGGSVAAGLDSFAQQAVTLEGWQAFPFVFDALLGDLRWAVVQRRLRAGTLLPPREGSVAAQPAPDGLPADRRLSAAGDPARRFSGASAPGQKDAADAATASSARRLSVQSVPGAAQARAKAAARAFALEIEGEDSDADDDGPDARNIVRSLVDAPPRSLVDASPTRPVPSRLV
jgi:hypothetical protein